MSLYDELKVEEIEQKAKFEIYMQKGIKFLDEVKPNWFNEIDIDFFDFENPCLCILGQLYGSFFDGVKELIRYSYDESVSAYKWGFDFVTYVPHEYIETMWVTEILKRRNLANE